MPGGDGTGPAGMGPMTGRAAGYCAGYSVPGFANPIPGRAAWGRAPYYEAGRAWGPAPYAGTATPYSALPRAPLGAGVPWAGRGFGRGFGWGRGFGGGRGFGRGRAGRGGWW
jgi:hypothetical protein